MHHGPGERLSQRDMEILGEQTLGLICANSSPSGYQCLGGERSVTRADEPLYSGGGWVCGGLQREGEEGEGRWMKGIAVRLRAEVSRQGWGVACERASLLSLWEWAPLVLRMTSVLRLRKVCRVFVILPLKLSSCPPPFSGHVCSDKCESGGSYYFFFFTEEKYKT